MALPVVTAPWYVGTNGATTLTRGVIQQRAREILESPDYKASFDRRLKSDALPAALEVLIWHYAYGKPLEQVELTVNQREDLSGLSIDELMQKAEELRKALEDAQSLNDALPVEYKVQ